MRLLSLALFLVAFFAVPTAAVAAPVGAEGSISTDGGAKGSGSGGKFAWPELVVSGNAVSFLAPFQIGIASYLPKARFAFQYDRQILKGHWVHVGAAFLADRGNWENFRLPGCGLPATSGADVCRAGGVVGFDIYAGYTYKWFIKRKPFIVPMVRGSLGYSFWALPELGDGVSNRRQIRQHTNSLSIRPGGGVRIFLLDQLGIGADINLPIGFQVHADYPLTQGKQRNYSFLFGMEIMPLIVEYRF